MIAHPSPPSLNREEPRTQDRQRWLDGERQRLALDLRDIRCEMTLASDALERAGFLRLSQSDSLSRRAALCWLQTEEGRAAYAKARELRPLALAAVLAYDRAQVRRVGRSLGEPRSNPKRWGYRTLCAVHAAIRVWQMGGARTQGFHLFPFTPTEAP